MNIRRLFNFARLSIVQKIYVLIAVAIIPISLSIFITLGFFYHNGENGKLTFLKEITNSVANNLDNFINDKKYNLEQISKNEQIVTFLSAEDKSTSKYKITKVLNEITSYLSYQDSNNFLFLMDTKGECLTSCNISSSIQDIKHLSIFKEALQGRAYVTPLINAKTQTEFLISHPVKSEKNEIIGVIILKLDEKYIWDKFLQMMNDNGQPNSNIFLVDNDNTIFIQSNNQKSQKPELLTNNKEKAFILPTANINENVNQLSEQQVNDINKNYIPKKHNQRIYASIILPKQRWIIGVNVPESEFLNYLIELIKIIMLIILITVGITIIIAFYLANSISQPINALIKTAQAVNIGEFEQVLEIANHIKIPKNDDSEKVYKLTKKEISMLIKTSKHQDGLGQLIRIFISMASNIKEREQNQKKQIEKLNIQIDHQKKSRDVKNLTDTEKFESLKSTIDMIKYNIRNMSCPITQ